MTAIALSPCVPEGGDGDKSDGEEEAAMEDGDGDLEVRKKLGGLFKAVFFLGG